MSMLTREVLQLSSILDVHAPEHKFLVTQRNPTTWSSDGIKPEKKKTEDLKENGEKYDYKLIIMPLKLKETRLNTKYIQS